MLTVSADCALLSARETQGSQAGRPARFARKEKQGKAGAGERNENRHKEPGAQKQSVSQEKGMMIMMMLALVV